MIAMLTLFALLSSYFIASGLSRTQGEVNLERERRSLQALQEAKAALIAYAASYAWGNDGANDQPGALPCPAADDIGTAGGSCSATASTRVGRLPWKTIGAQELRDASGEILWYAVDAKFHKLNGVHSTVINSDTQATMSVTGSAPASNVVAVIIAPGVALNGQDRINSTISNYLESTNASGTDTFVTKAAPDTFNNLTDREVVFNDKIVVITQADLMAVVEPAVAARIERDIKPYIQRIYSEDSTNLGWRAFPYPAIFANPSPGTSGAGTSRAQSSYLGTTSQTSGLLPITSSASYTWTTNSGTITLIGGIADSSISSSNCQRSGTNWQCSFTLNSLNSVAVCGSSSNRHCMANPRIRVTGRISANAGVSFADLPPASIVTSNRTLLSNPAATIGGSLDSSGVGTVTYEASQSFSRYRSSSFSRSWTITIPAVVASPLTSSSDTTAGWFTKNEWYRQTYYAVSSGYLPGGSGSCTPGSTCLTVNNLSSNYPTSNDKIAVLVFAGRALTGTRPSSSLADYLEGENQTPADRIFTHRFGSASTFNDRAIVLYP